jgi:hypothetical protein
MLVSRGHLMKHSCQQCGSLESQAHHPDYSNPRLVEWRLCRPCHLALHQAEAEKSA